MAISETSSRGGMALNELLQQCGAGGEESKAGMSARNILGPSGADRFRRVGRKEAQALQGLRLINGMTMCQRLCPKRRKAVADLQGSASNPGSCRSGLKQSSCEQGPQMN